MRILLLNYEFPPIGGGAGKATCNLARELANLGHRVDVLTAGVKNQQAVEKMDGFTIYRVKTWRKGIHDCGFRGAITFVLFAAFKFIRLTRQNRYDIIHYFFAMPTGFLSLLPGSHNKTPYFISLRGSDVPGYDPFNRRLEKIHRLMLPVTRRILESAEQVIAVTDSLKDTACRTTRLPSIQVVPNGVEAIFLEPFPVVKKRNNGLKLICVARLVERKGVHHILYALSEIQDPDISLLIVGSGSCEAKLKKICKDLSLDKRVTFFGFCHPLELPRLYAESDIFVLPSQAEAFGNVFAEAMACGLPVIGTNIGGIPDLVGKRNGTLIEPGDIQQLKQAILTLKHSQQLCSQMSVANRKKIIEKYSWEAIAKQHIRIYQGTRSN